MKGEKANGEGRSGTGEASRRARGATGLAWAEDETGQDRTGQGRTGQGRTSQEQDGAGWQEELCGDTRFLQPPGVPTFSHPCLKHEPEPEHEPDRACWC